MIGFILGLLLLQSPQILTDTGPVSAKDKDPDVVAARGVAEESCGAMRFETRQSASSSIASYAGSHGWRIEDMTPTYIVLRFGQHPNEEEIVDFLHRVRNGQFGQVGSPSVLIERKGAECPRTSAFTSNRI